MDLIPDYQCEYRRYIHDSYNSKNNNPLTLRLIWPLPNSGHKDFIESNITIIEEVHRSIDWRRHWIILLRIFILIFIDLWDRIIPYQSIFAKP